MEIKHLETQSARPAMALNNLVLLESMVVSLVGYVMEEIQHTTLIEQWHRSSKSDDVAIFITVENWWPERRVLCLDIDARVSSIDEPKRIAKGQATSSPQLLRIYARGAGARLYSRFFARSFRS